MRSTNTQWHLKNKEKKTASENKKCVLKSRNDFLLMPNGHSMNDLPSVDLKSTHTQPIRNTTFHTVNRVCNNWIETIRDKIKNFEACMAKLNCLLTCVT